MGGFIDRALGAAASLLPTVFKRTSEKERAQEEAQKQREREALANLRHQEAVAEDAVDSQRNIELAKQIWTALNLAYPGHNWWVYVDQKAGHYNIRNLSLSGKWGMVLHPNALQDVNKMAVQMGGELLERYNIARTRAGAKQAQEYLRKRPAHG